MRRLVLILCCVCLFISVTVTSRAQGEITVSVAEGLPEDIRAAVDALSEVGAFRRVDEASAQVKVINTLDRSAAAAQWTYVPVVPFATVADDIRYSDVLAYWQGNTATLAYLSGNGVAPTLVVSAATVAWLTSMFGAPAANVPIEIVPAETIPSVLWERRPASWSLIPFQQLDPILKALRLDGMDVFNRALPMDAYPLVQGIAVTGDPAQVESVLRALESSNRWQKINRDPDKMTILVMTGVTALVRATAWVMETTGIEYPAGDILPFLADADIVHTSIEVSFSVDCPYPDPSYQATGLIFCSRDSYFALLQAIKLKVVELTGNHVKDYGVDAMLHTLDIYDSNGISYFGGGRNQEDARRALVMAGRGGSIAFIGCNPAGPQFAWATADTPGAAACDDDFIRAEIAQMKAHGAV
ncbi:MAG: CapA family protein, partial [Anaerolineae bacterium]